MELGIFTRPTRKAFQRFVVSLDHLLSENVNEKFFPESVPRTELKDVRGKSVEQKIGSLRMLETWLFQIYKFSDPEAARKGILGPIKEIRKLRQTPAHKTTEDEYDTSFYEQRRDILIRVFDSLLALLEIFERHPKGVPADLPQQVRDRRIDRW